MRTRQAALRRSLAAGTGQGWEPGCRRSSRARAVRRPTNRRGSVLLVVFVIIMLLTFGVYGYTERMLAESAATQASMQAILARSLADSGVEVAAAYVDERLAAPDTPLSLYHQPDLFAGVLLRPAATARGTGRFSLIAPLESDVTSQQVRFGLIDESGKLNINAIPNLGLTEEQQHLMLMNLPLMTDDLADALLDFIDADDTPRTFGAEGEYYETLVPIQFAKNGPLEGIEELLNVRGVTPDLLFGEDANRNGLLDASENDGAASAPIDDADSVLRPGWDSFLTIYGHEPNVQADGTAKIFVNQSLLTDLFDAINPILGEDAARFIVAYRMNGPNDGVVTDTTTVAPGSSSATAAQALPSSQVNALAASLAKVIAGGGNQAGQVTRGGLDLSGGAQFKINSLYDLIDREVDVTVDKQTTTINSPWTTGSILTDFPKLHAALTLSENTVIEGRVNVNEARPQVLLGVPNITPQAVDAIIASRSSLASQTADHQTTAYLVSQSLIDLPTMRLIDPYLTAQGAVFQVRSVGYFDEGGPVVRVEAIIDGSTTPSKIVAYRDISHLGRGFAASQLLSTGGALAP